MRSEQLKIAIKDEFDKENCIVAFLDILGFREHVKNYVNSGYQDNILKKMEYALDNSLKSIKEGDNRRFNLIRHKIFSDCTCLSVPEFNGTEIEASMLCLLMTTIKGYTFHLIDQNIYLRGGVSFGFHHEDDNIIFSEGLIKAYDLEHKKAIYPRTIIDDELVKRFKRLWVSQREIILKFGIEKKIITDKKGTAFINPFNLLQSMSPERIEKEFNNQNELLRSDYEFNMKILRNVEDKIEKYQGNKHVLTKYLWLKDLINWNMDPTNSKIKFEYLLKD